MVVDKTPKDLLLGAPKGASLDDVFRTLTIGNAGEKK
jgi:hypothetical protein